MRVWVDLPEVEGETVRFRWRQDRENHVQPENEFFFRYEHIDLGAFSTELLYEIFLALELRPLTAYDEPVELIFPLPISRYSVDFWIAYHGADNVLVTPLRDDGTFSPWSAEPTPGPRKARA